MSEYRMEYAFASSLFALLLLAASTGCNNDETSCDSAADCPQGQVCTNGICLRTGDDAPTDDATDTGVPRDSDDPDTKSPPDIVPDVPPDDTTSEDTTDTYPPDPDIVSPDTGDQGPQIAVTPSGELSFGTITVPSTTTEKIVVRNAGDAPLSLTDAGLTQTPSDGFEVDDSPRLPQNLAPGQTATFEITFDPQQQARYENGFYVESNDRDPSDRRVEIELEGTAFNKVRQPCLFSTPDTLDFGIVSPGNTGTEAITIGNCSLNRTVTVTSYDFLSNPNDVFSVASSSPQPPFQVGVNQTKTVRLQFAPTSKRSLQGQLSIRSDETTGGGDYVDLVASGGGCAEAVATAEIPKLKYDRTRSGPIGVGPGDSVALDGSDSTSPSGKKTYKWTLTKRPSGSTATISSANQAQTTLAPDEPGLYTAKLEVWNSATGKKGCVTDTIDVISLADPADLTVTGSWQAPHDLDLHVIRSDPNGRFPNFRDNKNDVYPQRPAQNWGDSNTRIDDAFHHGNGGNGNSSNGGSGERISVASLESDRDYRIALHFRDADGFRPARFDSTAEITIGGSTQSLSHRWTIRDRNKFWIVFEIDGKTGAISQVDRER